MKNKQAPYTPMMMQYLAIKERYPDTLIFFRLGDFYELFFHDAEIASKILGLVLTGKHAGREERVPMCGVPHHSSKSYIARLVERGYRVGLVEQLEDAAVAKGLVERDVTQIFTPGAFVDRDEGDHQFLLALEAGRTRTILAYADIVTGDVMVDVSEQDPRDLIMKIRKIEAKEIILDEVLEPLLQGPLTSIGLTARVERDCLDLALTDDEEINHALGRLYSYLQQTQKRPLTYLKQPVLIFRDAKMELDADTIQHLELVTSLKNQTKYGSLYWLLDETKTVMGSRLLKQWIIAPLKDRKAIEKRYAFVDALLDQRLLMESLSSTLEHLYDIPRILTRLHYRNANARDVLSLKKSLETLPRIVQSLSQLSTDLSDDFLRNVQPEKTIVELLERALLEDVPVSIKEGMLFKTGYDATLDEWIALAQGGREQLAQLELMERERTGIKNLKVGYNRVFGYYLEISNGQLPFVRPEFLYERKQTLTNGERFVTPELKQLELKLLHAQDQRVKCEEALFHALVETLIPYVPAWHRLAETLSQIDVLLSFAMVSSRYHYIRPTLTENRRLILTQSRHPVIEKVMKKSSFVANDITLDDTHHTMLITGPNMGGKSTFMRQVALTVILAQIGCFVPAQHAEMMVFDHVFTRMGASDDLVGGQSTFMMEMTQTQYALAQATSSSLLIFDEIGRGTSTYDGMALAQAILEYVETTIQCKTLFSTHYHELTALDTMYPNLTNVHAAVLEKGDEISFQYKMLPGSMQRSYGVHVATLAGLPKTITSRAMMLLKTFEQNPTHQAVTPPLPIHEPSPVEHALRTLNPLTMSPLEALQWLIDMKKKVD